MASPTNLQFKNIGLSVSGIEEYLKKIEAVGNSVDEAVKEAISESSKPLHSDIKEGLKRHVASGASLEGLVPLEVKQEGNEVSSYVGVDGNAANDKAWHIVFVEYGGKHNAADPFIGAAFTENEAGIKRKQREVLKKRGMPVD